MFVNIFVFTNQQHVDYIHMFQYIYYADSVDDKALFNSTLPCSINL